MYQFSANAQATQMHDCVDSCKLHVRIHCQPDCEADWFVADHC